MHDTPLANELMRQQRFLRGLARELVRDAHLADDLVQQTNASALEHGPADPGALRGWMRSVARRLASKMRRRDALRGDGEQWAAREEAQLVPGALEIEGGRAVLDALAKLPEAYRRVLVLRFWHDQTPTQIAHTLRVPLNTIKARLARGLDAMQVELDRRAHGDRDAWFAALVAMLRPEPSSSAPIARFLRLRRVEIAVAATALLFAIGLTLGVDRTPRSVPMTALTAASCASQAAQCNFAVHGVPAVRCTPAMPAERATPEPIAPAAEVRLRSAT
jgi:RNA polymerase sigma-70 factor (ECF subfamily)